MHGAVLAVNSTVNLSDFGRFG